MRNFKSLLFALILSGVLLWGSFSAVTAFYYGKHFLALYNKETDYDTNTIKVSLHTSTYAPAQDTDAYWSAATNEVTGTGYTAGGATLGSKTITYTAATNTIALDAADSSWASSTITARYAVVYDSTPGTAATDPLYIYQNFGADVSTTAGTFTIVWNASGIATVVVS